MTTTVTRSRVLAPALAAALLAVSCGRSLTLDDRPGNAGRGAGGSSANSDGGDAASRGGSSGATGTGVGGASGIGGMAVQPDAGADRITNNDVGTGTVDVRPPDIAPDRMVSPPDVGGCPVDCTKLPHVRAGAAVSCVNGVCNFYYGTCDPGFAHCSSTPNVGCEADLSMSPNCGGCGILCYAGSSCQTVNSYNYCLADCQAPTPNRCDFSCVDLQTDVANCGSCATFCTGTNQRVECQQGKCVTLGCNDSTVADCTSDPGCETLLGNDPNCGGCNDPACALNNTMYTCSDGVGCKASVCAIGYANCNTTSPDCETTVASPAAGSGGCLPQYVGSVGLAVGQLDSSVSAVAADGSFFIAGTYLGIVDFDPSSAGKDVADRQ